MPSHHILFCNNQGRGKNTALIYLYSNDLKGRVPAMQRDGRLVAIGVAESGATNVDVGRLELRQQYIDPGAANNRCTLSLYGGFGGGVIHTLMGRPLIHARLTLNAKALNLAVLHAPSGVDPSVTKGYLHCCLNSLGAPGAAPAPGAGAGAAPGAAAIAPGTWGTEPWLIIGDMNNEPTDITSSGSLALRGAQVLFTGVKTRPASAKELDYALYNTQFANCFHGINAIAAQSTASDHLPILISFDS